MTAAHEVRLRVSLHGFDDDDDRYEARGMTVNVSRGGALVHVDRTVPVGSRCLLHLPGAEPSIGRSLIYGSVRRSLQREHGFEVAIEFHTRLPSLSLGDTLDKG